MRCGESSRFCVQGEIRYTSEREVFMPADSCGTERGT